MIGVTGRQSQLGQDFLHHPRLLNAGKSLIKPLVTEREPLMVNTELVQNGCVQVSDMNRVLKDVVTVVIRFSMFITSLDSRTCHPCGKTPPVVVTTMIVFC